MFPLEWFYVAFSRCDILWPILFVDNHMDLIKKEWITKKYYQEILWNDCRNDKRFENHGKLDIDADGIVIDNFVFKEWK